MAKVGAGDPRLLIGPPARSQDGPKMLFLTASKSDHAVDVRVGRTGSSRGFVEAKEGRELVLAHASHIAARVVAKFVRYFGEQTLQEWSERSLRIEAAIRITARRQRERVRHAEISGPRGEVRRGNTESRAHQWIVGATVLMVAWTLAESSAAATSRATS